MTNPDLFIDSFGARWQDPPPPRCRAAVLGINLTDALLNPPDDPNLADIVARQTGRDPGVRDYVLNTPGADRIITDAVHEITALLTADPSRPVQLLVNCWYGRHRAPAVASEIGVWASVDHHHIDRPPVPRKHPRADCPFCAAIIHDSAPAAIVRAWRDTIAIRPRGGGCTDGHVLVIPRGHVDDATTDPVVSGTTMQRAAELAAELGSDCNLITWTGRHPDRSPPPPARRPPHRRRRPRPALDHPQPRTGDRDVKRPRRKAVPTSPAPLARPVIVTLCGSTRHWDALVDANARETLDGKMVLAPGVDMKTRDQWPDPDEAAQVKQMLDALHRAKIRAADEVLVVNEGGYIGESTRAEIAYALHLGKKVRYTETYEHAVLITRPGLDDIRLGPFHYRHQAEQVTTALAGQLPHTAHTPGTTITSVPYDPTQPHHGLPATTDPHVLALSMDNAGDPAQHGANFPDTQALLAAWHGPDRAAELWTTACEIHDHLHTDPDDENQ